ncbi:MAG: hypothetical protein LBC18_02170 [Opitutaceae bacterium]|jgi:hypothetical protein|nr:hypothetical protein [Opitutaceae bacterium]
MKDKKYTLRLENVVKQHFAPLKKLPVDFLLALLSSKQKKELKRILNTNNRRLYSNKDGAKILAAGDCGF